MKQEPKYMNVLMLAQALSAAGNDIRASGKIADQIIQELKDLNTPAASREAPTEKVTPGPKCDCPDCNGGIMEMTVVELQAKYSQEQLLDRLGHYGQYPETTIGELKHLAEAAGLHGIAVVAVQ